MKNQMFIPQSNRPSARRIATDLFVKRIMKPEPVSRVASPAKPAKPIDKGARNGTCNISSCNNTHAIHYNQVMEKYYCTRCASRINSNKTADGPALCSWPSREHLDEDHLLKPDAPVDYFPPSGQ